MPFLKGTLKVFIESWRSGTEEHLWGWGVWGVMAEITPGDLRLVIPDGGVSFKQRGKEVLVNTLRHPLWFFGLVFVFVLYALCVLMSVASWNSGVCE